MNKIFSKSNSIILGLDYKYLEDKKDIFIQRIIFSLNYNNKKWIYMMIHKTQNTK